MLHNNRKNQQNKRYCLGEKTYDEFHVLRPQWSYSIYSTKNKITEYSITLFYILG